MKKLVCVQLVLLCSIMIFNMTACRTVNFNHEIQEPVAGTPAPILNTEKIEAVDINIEDIQDVCVLGSPITIEQTVQQGWDENGEEIMAAIIDAVKEAGITNGMLQTEAIAKINAYLCERTVYGENIYCRTPRGALILHQAVCVGYTLAFQYMAQYCGINAVYVHGYAKTTAHGWNRVYFSDGSYLEVDVTMNDTSGKIEKYLLISAEEMEKLHFE